MLAVGLAIFKLLVDTKPQQTAAQVQERIWRVEVESVEPRPLAPEIALYGQVETPDLLKIAASAPARVAEVAVRDGDRVSAGDLLVRLDERDFLPDVAQAEAEVAELEAEIESEKNRLEADRRALEQEQALLGIARDAVDRAQRLTRQRVGSETELDQAEEALARQALAVNIREMGLMPLLFETSFQAQFLIPMATSIAFGLGFATVLVLFVIPALLSIYEDAATLGTSGFAAARGAVEGPGKPT